MAGANGRKEGARIDDTTHALRPREVEARSGDEDSVDLLYTVEKN